MTGKYQKQLKEAAKRRAEIVRLHRSGRYTYSEIGARMGVSKQRVHFVLRKEGVV